LELNRNPINYFAEIEQAVFSPSYNSTTIDDVLDPILIELPN